MSFCFVLQLDLSIHDSSARIRIISNKGNKKLLIQSNPEMANMFRTNDLCYYEEYRKWP